MTLTYSYIPNEGRDSCPGYSAQFIVPMYHGTTFYGICMILACGGLIDATGVDLGTTFLAAKGIDGDVNGQAFIYLTPNYNTAKGYATPQNVFGDGCLHSVTLEMCVNQKGVKHARKHAGNAPSGYRAKTNARPVRGPYSAEQVLIREEDQFAGKICGFQWNKRDFPCCFLKAIHIEVNMELGSTTKEFFPYFSNKLECGPYPFMTSPFYDTINKAFPHRYAQTHYIRQGKDIYLKTKLDHQIEDVVTAEKGENGLSLIHI